MWGGIPLLRSFWAQLPEYLVGQPKLYHEYREWKEENYTDDDDDDAGKEEVQKGRGRSSSRTRATTGNSRTNRSKNTVEECARSVYNSSSDRSRSSSCSGRTKTGSNVRDLAGGTATRRVEMRGNNNKKSRSEDGGCEKEGDSDEEETTDEREVGVSTTRKEGERNDDDEKEKVRMFCLLSTSRAITEVFP